jgi:hypothetical protein
VIGVWDFSNMDGAYATVPGGGGVVGGDVTTYNAVLGSGPDVVSNDETDYVLSGGSVCFDYTGGNTEPAPGDAIVPCSGAHDYEVANNLGDNQAAYALFFPEMNALIASLDQTMLANYSLHIDFRLGCDPAWYGGNPDGLTDQELTDACLAKRLTNGGEAIFIGAAFERPPICIEFPDLPECQPPTIPEPGTMSLLGMALAALGFISLRKSGLNGSLRTLLGRRDQTHGGFAA